MYQIIHLCILGIHTIQLCVFFLAVILASFFGIEVLIVLDSDPQTAASGVWCTMFFIYMTYTLLALHLQECAVAGVLLGITQLAAGAALNYQDPNMGKQVRQLLGIIKGLILQ